MPCCISNANGFIQLYPYGLKGFTTNGTTGVAGVPSGIIKNLAPPLLYTPNRKAMKNTPPLASEGVAEPDEINGATSKNSPLMLPIGDVVRTNLLLMPPPFGAIAVPAVPGGVPIGLGALRSSITLPLTTLSVPPLCATVSVGILRRLTTAVKLSLP